MADSKGDVELGRHVRDLLKDRAAHLLESAAWDVYAKRLDKDPQFVKSEIRRLISRNQNHKEL